MQPAARDRLDDRCVPLTVALLMAAVAAMLGVGFALVVARQQRPDAVAGSAPAAAQQPTQRVRCEAALREADQALEQAQRLDAALAAHSRVMDDRLAERVTPAQAVDRSLPFLIQGAQDRKRFADEVAEYRGPAPTAGGEPVGRGGAAPRAASAARPRQRSRLAKTTTLSDSARFPRRTPRRR